MRFENDLFKSNYKGRKGSWDITRSYKKTCQTWSGLVNRDRAAWASRCRTGNRRGGLSALYCARLPQRTGTGRALALNAAAPRGYRRPRQESSRAGAARSLCPTAAGTGGTLALPYPAHSYALLTQTNYVLNWLIKQTTVLISYIYWKYIIIQKKKYAEACREIRKFYIMQAYLHQLT